MTSDYMPTILDVLRIQYPGSRPLDGTSILNALKGKQEEKDKPMGFICAPQVSWVIQQYKLVGDEKLGNL
jgi:hypothetical protein